MTDFLFIIIIIIFFNLLIISKSSYDCLSANDCFNCSVCGDESLDNCKCKWNENHCSSGEEIIRHSYFYKYFDSCIDSNSIKIMEKYCGSQTLNIDDKDEIEINIPKNGQIYGTPNLLCKYTFTPFNYEDTSFTIEYNSISTSDLDNVLLYMSLFFGDQKINGRLNEKPISQTYDKIRELEFYIYFDGIITTLPFSFKIIKNTSKSKKALYLLIGTIIIGCLFCIFIIYCLSRRIRYKARIRQRSLMILARQRAQYSSSEEDQGSSSRSNNVDEEEENKKKIDILLRTILAPKLFRQEYGKKDGNTCTICIVNFKEKQSRVSITPCQHVFHYKCLSNWLIQNYMNPKCPNCNYNLLEEFNKKKMDEILTIEILRKNTENKKLKIQNNQNMNTNGNSNDNAVITRNLNRRQRSRVSTRIPRSTQNNNIVKNVGPTPSGVPEQEIVVQNI